jgi:hypothetical protein
METNEFFEDTEEIEIHEKKLYEKSIELSFDIRERMGRPGYYKCLTYELEVMRIFFNGSFWTESETIGRTYNIYAVEKLTKQ